MASGRLVAVVVGAGLAVAGLLAMVLGLMDMVDAMTGDLAQVTPDSMVAPMVWVGGGLVAMLVGYAVAAAGMGKKRGEEGASVKVRCRACRALAPEDAKFCPACGKPM